MGVWVGEFARGAEFGAVEWVMPSRTLQIVCSGRFTLPLGRAPPSYPPTPTLLPLPPSFRRTPGPMVADRVMMGDIIGSTVTVGPGVRRDDGRGWVGLCGWTGRGRTANGRTGELANCELRTAPTSIPPIELNRCPQPPPSPPRLHLQLSRCNAERAPVDCHRRPLELTSLADAKPCLAGQGQSPCRRTALERRRPGTPFGSISSKC